jgi:hypothetical protein
MIQKLLLVRKAQSRSDLLKVAGVEQFAAGKPLNVSPVAWHDEHGLSHYGYVLSDMTLQAFQALDKHCEGTEGTDAVGARRRRSEDAGQRRTANQRISEKVELK